MAISNTVPSPNRMAQNTEAAQANTTDMVPRLSFTASNISFISFPPFFREANRQDKPNITPCLMKNYPYSNS